MARFAPVLFLMACSASLSVSPKSTDPGADGLDPVDAEPDTDTDTDADTDSDTDADTDSDTDTDTDSDTDATGLLPAEICDDNVDNDGDGQRDCTDPDCAADPACVPACPDLTGGVGTTVGDTTGTGDDQAPSCGGAASGPDVYVEFTAPSAGTWAFDTVGSSFDTVLSAFDQCGGVELGCDDDTVGDAGLVLLDLVANETVYLSIDGRRAGDFGSFTVTATLVPASELDCADGADGDLDGDTDCADVDCAADPACATCPDAILVSSPFVASTTGLSDDGVQSCAGTAGAPDGTVQFTASSAGLWTFSTVGSSFDTVLTVADGCGGPVLACDDDTVLQASVASVSLSAGQTVILVVDGFDALDSGAFTLSAVRSEQACSDGLDDDGDGTVDCDDADCAASAACSCLDEVLGSGVFLGDNTGAGDDFEPSCTSTAGGLDVVFSYTAPSTGTFTFSTENSVIDTVVTVLDDCSGTELVCDDDGGLSPRASSASTTLVAGQQVAVVVDAYNSASVGTFELSAARTEGSCNDRVDGDGDSLLDCLDPDCDQVDECETCRYNSFLGVPGTIVESTLDAIDEFDPGCTTPVGGFDHAHAFFAPAAGTYTFDTIGSSFDTVLTVLDACPTASTELACDDDIVFTVNQQSELSVTLAAGALVWVVVDGYDSADFGDYVLNVR